jgi:putative spermidine/putrescine transport system ATP-binding protein
MGSTSTVIGRRGITPCGATIETTVECSGVSFTALNTPCQGMELGIGQAVSVTVPAQACRVLGA